MKYLLLLLTALITLTKADRDFPKKNVLILGERDGSYLEQQYIKVAYSLAS